MNKVNKSFKQINKPVVLAPGALICLVSMGNCIEGRFVQDSLYNAEHNMQVLLEQGALDGTKVDYDVYRRMNTGKYQELYWLGGELCYDVKHTVETQSTSKIAVNDVMYIHDRMDNDELYECVVTYVSESVLVLRSSDIGDVVFTMTNQESYQAYHCPYIVSTCGDYVLFEEIA